MAPSAAIGTADPVNNITLFLAEIERSSRPSDCDQACSQPGVLFPRAIDAWNVCTTIGGRLQQTVVWPKNNTMTGQLSKQMFDKGISTCHGTKKRAAHSFV